MAVRRNFIMKRVCAKMVMVGCMKNDCRIKTEYRCLMVVGVVLGAGVLIYIYLPWMSCDIIKLAGFDTEVPRFIPLKLVCIVAWYVGSLHAHSPATVFAGLINYSFTRMII